MPARTRHCDRGCPPLPLRAEPLGESIAREGAARSTPEARRPASDRQAEEPSRGKGWSPMTHLLRGVLAAVLATSALCAPASAATVTVRVEGDTTTLVPLTSVTTQPGQVVKDGNPAHSCDAEHAIGALERATGGDWNGTWFNGLGYSVDTVKGESHNGANNDFFSFWIDGKSASQGVCDQTLADGDELLFYPDCFGAGCQSPSPLDLTVPATAQKGAPFNVHAVTLDGSGGSSPAAGVTVTAGGASATTDSGGDAALTVATTGSIEVRATKQGTVRST